MSLRKTIEFVKEKHKNQVDLAGKPYFFHLCRVMNNVPSPFKEVAILHDIFEDTDTTVNELLNLGVKQDIINSVLILTKSKQETYRQYINRIKEYYIATVVKLVDLKDNMDITRLDELTEKDIDRLKKYHKAYIYLKNR